MAGSWQIPIHLQINYFSIVKPYEKNAVDSLQLLSSMPLTAAHSMLHQCNIFTENFHAIPGQAQLEHK